MSDWPAYGRSHGSGETPVPVTKYKGKWWSRWELEVEKDSQKSKIKEIEKPVDDFNSLIRRCRV